jgi:D-alanyl-lipoteichoic acid acyltransferase DltB (MBOAT superfamily)
MNSGQDGPARLGSKGRGRLILAKTAIEFAIRPEGWIHSVQGGFDVPRGPVGVLFYLVFVPLFWIVPRRLRAQYLVISSLLLTVATVGPAFTVTLAALAVGGFVVVRLLAKGRSYWAGLALLVGGYSSLILHPQPAWLPPVKDPLFFYVHWAGIGYLFLRTVHVLNDVSRLKLAPPRLGEWLSYLLFAPTLSFRNFAGYLFSSI